jgi:hypothetical protein
MNAKSKAVLDRIERLKHAISIATEYLKNGEHANWKGFRPLFVRKQREGKELPPHKEWVKNVYIRRMEKTLSHAEKVLKHFEKANNTTADMVIQMPQRMIGIKVSIIRCVDDSQYPAFVECEFADAHGNIHQFTEKSVIITSDDVDSNTQFPYPAVIACVVIERCAAILDKCAYLIDTELPWHVSSTEDRTRFEVVVDDLVEWEFGSGCSEPKQWSGIA